MPKIYAGNRPLGDIVYDPQVVARFIYAGYDVKSDPDIDDLTYANHSAEIDLALQRLEDDQKLKTNTRRIGASPTDLSQSLTEGTRPSGLDMFTRNAGKNPAKSGGRRGTLTRFRQTTPNPGVTPTTSAPKDRPLIEASLGQAVKGLRRTS